MLETSSLINSQHGLPATASSCPIGDSAVGCQGMYIAWVHVETSAFINYMMDFHFMSPGFLICQMTSWDSKNTMK